jgi:HlyD family secretion protein
METVASIEEINMLKTSFDTIRNPELLSGKSLPEFTKLGELQGFYAIFLKNLSDLNSYKINDFYGGKVSSITEEINGIREYIGKLEIKEKWYYENQKLETRRYNRDSILFEGQAISESELERSRQSLIRINIELQQVRLDRSEKSIEMAEKRQLLQDFIIKRVEEREKLIAILVESFQNLKAQINIWENNYLLVSPVDGTVSFTRFWTENQSVVKDEPVVNIVPLQTGDYLGRINLKMLRSGKVHPNQMVNIKLSGYPYLEYGMVRGIVKSISLVPTGDAYVIEIELPNGLKTLYGINLEFTQNMQGTAEIITEGIRLLQKIINPFRYMLSKNKRD